MDFVDDFRKEICKQFENSKSLVLIKAISENGFDPEDSEFAKNNFSLIEIDGYEHLFYRHGTKDEKRIISFQTKMDLSVGCKGDDFKTNISATQNYY